MTATKAPCSCCLAAAISLLALLDFGLAMVEVAMGAQHLDNCLAQSNYIPVYLLVAGCAGLVQSLSNGVRVKMLRDSPNHDHEQKCRCLSNSLHPLVSLLALVWVIISMVWIFDASPTLQPPSISSSHLDAGLEPVLNTCEQLYQFSRAAVQLRFAVQLTNLLAICWTCCGVRIVQVGNELIPAEESQLPLVI